MRTNCEPKERERGVTPTTVWTERGEKKAKKHRRDERTCRSLGDKAADVAGSGVSLEPASGFPRAGSGAFPLATGSSCKIKKSLER